MKQSIFTVRANECIALNTYRMELEGDTSDVTAAGQFVNIKLDGFFLRRPYPCTTVTKEGSVLFIKSLERERNIWQALKKERSLTYLRDSATDMT